MKIKELIDQAASLPVEERVLMVDSLLRSLNPPQPEIDTKWGEIARRRLEEFRSGTVQTVSGEDVFDRVSRRFEK